MSLSDKGWSGAVGRYRVIGASSREDLPDCILIDTNVAIDIERFYFGTLRNSGHRSDLCALLLTFPWRDTAAKTVDVEYGSAICEAAWRRDGTFNAPGTRALRHALDRVLRDWTIEDTKTAFAHRYPPERRDKAWRRGVPLPDPTIEATYPLGLLLGPYATLLYTCYLDRTRSRWRSRGQMWPMRRLVSWSRDEFGAVCGYEITLARDIFLAGGARTDAARKMLKISGGESPDEIADKAWNAAWDFYFLRRAERRSYALDVSGRRTSITHLVTRNVDPWLIRETSRIAAIIDAGRYGTMSFLASDVTDIREDYADELEDLLHMDGETMFDRHQRLPEETVEQGLAALERLETEMCVTASTVDAYRRNRANLDARKTSSAQVRAQSFKLIPGWRTEREPTTIASVAGTVTIERVTANDLVRHYLDRAATFDLTITDEWASALSHANFRGSLSTALDLDYPAARARILNALADAGLIGVVHSRTLVLVARIDRTVVGTLVAGPKLRLLTATAEAAAAIDNTHQLPHADIREPLCAVALRVAAMHLVVVEPEHRRAGIGTLLVRHAIDTLRRAGVHLLYDQVDLGTQLDSFVTAAGFTMHDSGTVIDLEEMVGLPIALAVPDNKQLVTCALSDRYRASPMDIGNRPLLWYR